MNSSFIINQENVTRLCKNLKKQLSKEKIQTTHSQMLEVITKSFGYHSYHDLKKYFDEQEEAKRVIIIDLKHPAFINSYKTYKLIKKEKYSDVENIFELNKLSNLLYEELINALIIEFKDEKKYFVDLESIIESISELFKEEEEFFESGFFSRLLDMLTGLNVNGIHVEEKALNKILKIEKNKCYSLFFREINMWTIFHYKKQFKDYKELIEMISSTID